MNMTIEYLQQHCSNPEIVDDAFLEAYKRSKYAENRRQAYPAMSEQLDLLYHDTIAEPPTHVLRDLLTQVKSDNPKPTQADIDLVAQLLPLRPVVTWKKDGAVVAK